MIATVVWDVSSVNASLAIRVRIVVESDLKAMTKFFPYLCRDIEVIEHG